MTKQFSGPRAKVRASLRHRKAFEDEMRAYVERNSAAFTLLDSPVRRERTLLLELEPLPEDIQVIVGEIIQQLRSALDLLACDLARFSGAQNLKRVYFPIAQTEEGFWDKRAQDKIRRLSPELQDMVRDLKPFGNSALNALNEFANIDKHQALLTAFVSAGDVIVEGRYSGDPRERIAFHVDRPLLLGRQNEIMRVPFSTPVDGMRMQMQLKVKFAVEPAVGKDVADVLGVIGRSVETTIKYFEDYCFRGVRHRVGY